MTDIYPPFSILVSFITTTLTFSYLLSIGRLFERYPDRRAAKAVLIALTLFIVSAALMMSGISILFAGYEVSPGSIASISVARGALLICSIILWLERHSP